MTEVRLGLRRMRRGRLPAHGMLQEYLSDTRGLEVRTDRPGAAAGLGFDLLQEPTPRGKVVLKLLTFAAACAAKMLQICAQEGVRPLAQSVNHPSARTLRADKLPLLQVGQLFRDFDLRFPEQLLDVADAERTLGQQIQDAQSLNVGEALVEVRCLHGLSIPLTVYTVNRMFGRFFPIAVAGAG